MQNCRQLIVLMALVPLGLGFMDISELFPQFATEPHALFHTTELDYLQNVQNLSSIRELSEFFDTQSATYIDNVYTVYQKFFYKLLGDLPKSLRSKQIKLLAQKMDEFLVAEQDYEEKVRLYEGFMTEFSANFSGIFEYDPDETLLNAAEFNTIFVSNNVDEVLTYANDIQMRKFVEQTGDGIRLFLILNRPYLDKAAVPEFKATVDTFLASEEFLQKLICLKIFLKKADTFL